MSIEVFVRRKNGIIDWNVQQATDCAKYLFERKYFYACPRVEFSTAYEIDDPSQTPCKDARIFTFENITPADDASANFILSIISTRALTSPLYSDLIFSIEFSSRTWTPLDGVIFDSSYFAPITTKNQALLDELGVPESEIDVRFKCKISDNVMDRPVFHFNKTDLLFDESFLNYAVSTTRKNRIPFINIEYSAHAMQTNFELMKEINDFIIEKTNFKYEIDFRNALADCKLTYAKFEQDKLKTLDKALRRAAHSGKTATIFTLLKRGANINSQDTTQGLKMTALHYAIKCRHYEAAKELIRCGAALEIACDNPSKDTAASMIEAMPESTDKKILTDTIETISPSIHERMMRSNIQKTSPVI